jgi:hypothetical protein
MRSSSGNVGPSGKQEGSLYPHPPTTSLTLLCLLTSLHATSQPFHANLSKRKPTADPYPQDSSSSKDKILAGEALGLVMISHGEDVLRAGVGDRSYGDALERFGRARCKIAMVSLC